MRLLLLLVLFVSVHALNAQVSMPATTRSGIAELSAIADRFDDPAKLFHETQGRFPTAMVHGRCMVGFLGKVEATFDPSSSFSEHVRIGSRVGDVLSFRVDAYHLHAVNAIPGLAYAELAGCVAPTLDRAVKATRADSVQRGINLPQTYTGRDVLIGVLDWGFDYTHPMFYDTALTASRVRAAWDMWRQAGPAPSAFGYGTELTTPAALAAAESDTVNVYSNATHGSHVAGIAGGGGAGTNYRGFAFDAQFVFCTFLIDAAAVLDGFAWMKSVADLDQKRLVVNCSWGLYYMGTLDGNSLISQAIDQLSSEGVVFVNSGGNNGDVNFHIKKIFSGDTLRSNIQFYPYSAHPSMWGQSITMWGDEGGAFSTGFRVTSSSGTVLQQTPWYHSSTQPTYLDSIIVEGADTVYFNLTADAAHPLNGRPHFRLRVKNTSPALRIQLKAAADEGTVHFWNVTELSNGVGNWGMAFLGGSAGLTAGDKNYGISEPACTESTITVAAYSAEFFIGSGQIPVGGAIADFSSFGPTLDERMKPDITAPGLSVVSSISSFTDNSYTPTQIIAFQGRDYPFAAFSGTSMSSPAVAGIAALILEADPDITPAELRALLKSTARTDNQTGTIPVGGSTRWGMGKVNAYRAVCDALGVVGVSEADEVSALLWPNPVVGMANLITGLTGEVRVIVTDASGRVVLDQQGLPAAVLALDLGGLGAGVYAAQVQQAGRTMVFRLVKE
jgi:minor extracellular serine protease Vpr